MRRLILGVLLTFPLLLTGLSPAQAADPSPAPDRTVVAKDVPAFQTARNRQSKAMKFGYVRMCPNCEGYQYTNPNFPKATGTVKMRVNTYKILDQNRRYDFFIVDATADITSRTGDEDWGWLDTSVRSAGKTKIIDSSYTLGKKKQNTTSCNSYPVELAVSFYGVSAGTTAGHVSFCNKGSEVRSSSVPGGRFYHATGVSGISMIQMQRYVQVPQGKLPSFKVLTEYNKDSSNCATWADGYHCWVNHGTVSKKLFIGTAPQR